MPPDTAAVPLIVPVFVVVPAVFVRLPPTVPPVLSKTPLLATLLVIVAVLVSVPLLSMALVDVSVPAFEIVEPTALETLVADSVVPAAIETPRAAVDLLSSVPMPLIVPAPADSVIVPVPWFVILPVTTTLPDLRLIWPSLAIVAVPLDSVAVPPGPLKLIMPAARLLMSPASMTLPLVATLIVPRLFSVFVVPCSVAPSPTLMVPASLLLMTPAASVRPAPMLMVAVLLSVLMPVKLPPVTASTVPPLLLSTLLLSLTRLPVIVTVPPPFCRRPLMLPCRFMMPKFKEPFGMLVSVPRLTSVEPASFRIPVAEDNVAPAATEMPTAAAEALLMSFVACSVPPLTTIVAVPLLFRLPAMETVPAPAPSVKLPTP